MEIIKFLIYDLNSPIYDHFLMLFQIGMKRHDRVLDLELRFKKRSL